MLSIYRLGLLFALAFLLVNQAHSHYNPQIYEFEQYIRDHPDLKQVELLSFELLSIQHIFVGWWMFNRFQSFQDY